MFVENLLEGKSILVTGGGSGLGLAMAKRFASLGAKVAICGRTQEKLDKAAEEISEGGAVVATYQCDVRDFNAVKGMIQQIPKDLGELNGLINNAAGNFYCASEELSENGFKTVVDIVLTGTFNCCRHFGEYLISNKTPGTIINIVTTYTETGSAFVLPSACAKAGVAALTTSLAYEWATYGIRVNSIAPGPFPTKGAWDRLMPGKDFEEILRKQHPMQRFGDKNELADLASYLMSDGAGYINGECVTIDGGHSLRGGEFNFLTNMMPREKLKKLFRSMKAKR